MAIAMSQNADARINFRCRQAGCGNGGDAGNGGDVDGDRGGAGAGGGGGGSSGGGGIVLRN